MFICRDTKKRQKEVLTRLYYSLESIRHRDLFSLCADIDYSSLKLSIIKCLLLDLKLSYEELKNKATQFNCDTIKTKAEILLAGNSIIYLSDKDRESGLLNDFFKGDSRAFNKLSKNGPHITTTITGVASHWFVIVQEGTIKSDILNILKSRKPSYFRKTHQFFNTDPELELSIMMEVGKQPEVKFNLALDSLKNINKDKETGSIESLPSFENAP